MNKRLSLLLPTRGRPAGLNRLVESVVATADHPENIEILAYIDSDDSSIPEYRSKINELSEAAFKMLRVFIGPPVSVSISWNTIASLATGDVLMMANDDQVYCQKGWDTRLNEVIRVYPDGIYCIWFNDDINGWKHCAFPIVSREWYTTLGYFTPGVFRFLYNDTWIMDVAQRLNRLHYISDVKVLHLHHTVNKSEIDETYDRHRQPDGPHSMSVDPLIYAQTAPIRQRDAERLAHVIESFAPQFTTENQS